MIALYRQSTITLLSLIVLCTTSYATVWDVSGDLRERYQSFDNFDFNSSVDNNSSEIDSRLYIKAKGAFDNGLSVFLQPQAVYIRNTTTAGSKNLSQIDLLQAYLQYDIGKTTITAGRQQLVYGDQRLLGHLGWKDVARTFDGLKLSYQHDMLKVDAFAVHPANIVAMTPTVASPKGESLVTWNKRNLIGIYATYTTAPKTGFDAYLINWNHENSETVGAGRNMNTFGGRGFGKWGNIDATAELTLQTGTWKTGVAQRASAYAIKAGYNLDVWKTRLGVEYNYSPGDEKTYTTTQKNFIFPFHTNHAHYGEMDRFSWANMKNLRLSIKTSPNKVLTLLANVHFLSLDQATGDWLNVVGVGTLFDGSPAYTQTDAGTEIDLKVVYKVEQIKGLKIVANYSTFNPGAAVAERNAGKADTASFGYLIAQYVF